jgi:hypothetical protein
VFGIVTTTLASTRFTIAPGMYRTRPPSLIPAARPARSTMTASRESSRTNVTVLCANAAAVDGALPFDATKVIKPAVTDSVELAPASTPRTATEPSVVLIVDAPEGSTRTVNAVPVTDAVDVGVVTE